VHPTEDPLEAVGDGEDPEHVARVAVDPAVEARLAGDVQLEVGLGDGELGVSGFLAALHAEPDGRPGLVLLDLRRQLHPVRHRLPVDRHDDVPHLEPGPGRRRVAVDGVHRRGRRGLALERVPISGSGMVSWASLVSSPLFTPSLTVVPGLYFWISAASSTRSATGFPLTDTMMSPTLSPALAAAVSR